MGVSEMQTTLEKPDRAPVNIRAVDRGVWRLARQAADREGLKMSAYVERALREALKKTRK